MLTFHFICKVRKGCVGFYWERELGIEHNCNILTPHSYDRHVVSFLFSWCSTGGLGPTAGCWLSLLHLISIFFGPQTPSGSPRAPSVGYGFPYHISFLEHSWQLHWPSGRRTHLNYIIVRRPLDLWNRMFNRHLTEITVMQFRGHSLPVYHSVVYHGNFFSSSHFISNFRPRDFHS